MEKIKNFYKLIEKYSLSNPDKTLICIDNQNLSYKDFIHETTLISNLLIKNGITENKKIGLIIPNSLEWYKIYWAAIRIGAQPVPIDPQSGELELNRLMEYTDIELCFASVSYRNNNILNTLTNIHSQFEKIQKYIIINNDDITLPNENFTLYSDFIKENSTINSNVFNPDEEHLMSLACTSGSTGNPKILSVPYQGFYDAIVDISDYLEFSEKDTMMIGMPLYHQGGFGMGMQVVVKGGTVLYQPKFDPINFLETVQNKKITVIQLTSTLAKILLSAPNFYEYDLSSVKICYFAGEVLPREIAEIFVDKLNIRVINVIGSSETATMVVWDSKHDYANDPSDFRCLPFTEIKVLNQDNDEVDVDDIGELFIYTTAVIFNYYNNESESMLKVKIIDDKRWFYTGDLVKRLSDGRIRFIGRSKRIIKRGANLVHAEEVEAFLLTHPKIEAIAITSEDHPVIGQQILAYIQTIANEKITRGELARYFDGKLSSYKLPDKIILTDNIPLDIGKVQYKFLRNK